MNLMGLVGILLALGMYALARYMQRSKTVEAVSTVSALATSAAAYYNASDSTQPAGTKPEAAHAMRHFPASSKDSVPKDFVDVRGKRYASGPGDWSVSPWRDLKFSIQQPQFYSYSFQSSGVGSSAKAFAVASGDLDGDGHSSTYKLAIEPDPSATAHVAGQVERIDPEE